MLVRELLMDNKEVNTFRYVTVFSRSPRYDTRIFKKIGLNLTNNPHIPNIDAISGSLFTLRIQYKRPQTQCDEGARDGIDVWYMGIIC